MFINQRLDINQKILRNRIVMPPMATGKAVDGAPSEAQISHAGDEAERLLEENAADLIGVGRSMMKDPKWTQKAISI